MSEIKCSDCGDIEVCTMLCEECVSKQLHVYDKAQKNLSAQISHLTKALELACDQIEGLLNTEELVDHFIQCAKEKTDG